MNPDTKRGRRTLTSTPARRTTGSGCPSKRGLALIPLGSASSDFYGADRVGDDLYANSLLVLVHHDIWDRDLNAPPAFATLHKDGKTIDAVAQTTKSGYVFVFDRETSKPVFPIEERPYPASDIPGSGRLYEKFDSRTLTTAGKLAKRFKNWLTIRAAT